MKNNWRKRKEKEQRGIYGLPDQCPDICARDTTKAELTFGNLNF
jgi:hypothetical protein